MYAVTFMLGLLFWAFGAIAFGLGMWLEDVRTAVSLAPLAWSGLIIFVMGQAIVSISWLCGRRR